MANDLYYPLHNEAEDIDNVLIDLISILEDEENVDKFVKVDENETGLHFIAGEGGGGGSSIAIDANQFELISGDGEGNGIHSDLYTYCVKTSFFEPIFTNGTVDSTATFLSQNINFISKAGVRFVSDKSLVTINESSTADLYAHVITGDAVAKYKHRQWNSSLQDYEILTDDVYYFEVPLFNNIEIDLKVYAGGQWIDSVSKKFTEGSLQAFLNNQYSPYFLTTNTSMTFDSSRIVTDANYNIIDVNDPASAANAKYILWKYTNYPQIEVNSEQSNNQNEKDAYLQIELDENNKVKVSFLLSVNFTEQCCYLNTTPSFIYSYICKTPDLQLSPLVLNWNDTYDYQYFTVYSDYPFSYFFQKKQNAVKNNNTNMYELVVDKNTARQRTYSFGTIEPNGRCTFYIGTDCLNSENVYKSGLTMKDDCFLIYEDGSYINTRNNAQLFIEDGMFFMGGNSHYSGTRSLTRLAGSFSDAVPSSMGIGNGRTLTPSSAFIRLEDKAQLNLQHTSTLLMKSGSSIYTTDQALIDLRGNSYIAFYDEAKIKATGNSRLFFDNAQLSIDGNSNFSELSVLNGSRFIMQTNTSSFAPVLCADENHLLFMSKANPKTTSTVATPASFGRSDDKVTVDNNNFTNNGDTSGASLSIRRSKIMFGGTSEWGNQNGNYCWIDIGGVDTTNNNTQTQIQINDDCVIRICGTDKTNHVSGSPVDDAPWNRLAEISESTNATSIKLFDGAKFCMRGVWGTDSSHTASSLLTQKSVDSPLMELIENAEFRMSGDAVFKIDSNGITMSDGTDSVTFTVQQLIDVLNLPNASNVQF